MSEVAQDFVDLANRLADASRPILRSYYRRKLDVDIKSDASPVTQADREAEAAIRKLINATFPEHGIFGEEFGKERETAEYVWVLDPLDGTRAFVTGRPASDLKNLPSWPELSTHSVSAPRVLSASLGHSTNCRML